MASLLFPLLSSSPVYLYDVYAFKPPASYKVNQVEVINTWRKVQAYSEEDLQFQVRVYERSGLSPHLTHLPPNINPTCVDGNKYVTHMDAAAAEARLVVGGAVEGLLKKTGLRATDIDILVTTCSIYCPTPSLASMVVNAFKMRRDVQSYHLGGMGCSNGVVGINLVADLLKARPNSTALFVTTEILTPAYYPGTDRHRLVTNLLFRSGAAAVLLSNKPQMRVPGGPASGISGPLRPKYQLMKRVRVHLGQSDEAISAINYGPDAAGFNGIYLGKNVVKEASRALSVAMTQVAPYVLTWRQLAEAGWDIVQSRRAAAADRRHRTTAPKEPDGSSGNQLAVDSRRPHPDAVDQPPAAAANGMKTASTAASASASATDSAVTNSTASSGSGSGDTASAAPAPATASSDEKSPATVARPAYRPNFTKSTVSHFLLHAGGAKVLDGLGEALQLDAEHLAPSRDVLWDYGNISSSTTWYTLCNVETLRGVRRGDKVLQIGVGSGIKCGVNVWKALRDVREVHDAWAHRLRPGELEALQLASCVDVAHGWSHVVTRGVFVVLMVLLAAAMHWLMLLQQGWQE